MTLSARTWRLSALVFAIGTLGVVSAAAAPAELRHGDWALHYNWETFYGEWCSAEDGWLEQQVVEPGFRHSLPIEETSGDYLFDNETNEYLQYFDEGNAFYAGKRVRDGHIRGEMYLSKDDYPEYPAGCFSLQYAADRSQWLELGTWTLRHHYLPLQDGWPVSTECDPQTDRARWFEVMPARIFVYDWDKSKGNFGMYRFDRQTGEYFHRMSGSSIHYEGHRDDDGVIRGRIYDDAVEPRRLRGCFELYNEDPGEAIL